MGFEASGVVAEVGSQVKNLKIGDKIATIVSSGGYAEYATGDASLAIPIPEALSFPEATTIPVQGISAYTLLTLLTLLTFAAKPQPNESVLVQAAAGGVGLYLVQLAKSMNVKKVIALASTKEKIDLLKLLRFDVAIDYSHRDWTEKVREATDLWHLAGGTSSPTVLKAQCRLEREPASECYLSTLKNSDGCA